MADTEKKKESKPKGAVKNEVLIDPDEREIAVPDDEDKVEDMIKAQQATGPVQESVDLKEAKEEDDKPKPAKPTKGRAIELLTTLASKHKKPDELHQAAEALKDINPKRISSALKKAAGAIEHSQTVKKEAKALIAKKKDREKAAKSREREKASAEKKKQREADKAEKVKVKTQGKAFAKPVQAGDPKGRQDRIAYTDANQPSFETNILPNLDAIKTEINGAKDLQAAKKLFNKHLGGYDTHFSDLSDFEHKNLTYRRLGRLQYMAGQAGGDDFYNTLLRGNIAKRDKADYVATWAKAGKKTDKSFDIDKDYDEHVNRQLEAATRTHKILTDQSELNKAKELIAGEPKPGQKSNVNVAPINTDIAKKTGSPTFADKMKALISRLKGR